MNTHKFVNNYYHMGGGLTGRPNSNSLARGSAVIMEKSGTGRMGDTGGKERAEGNHIV